MKFIETELGDAWLIEPEPMPDIRGFFARTFCIRQFAERGLETTFVQHSRSQSRTKGTLRGMHFQIPPHGECKVVSCLRGAMLDVIIDLRPQSRTYRKWQAFELSGDNRRQLYIPKGFAHGFQTLTDDVEVNYLISSFYEPNASSGVRFDDPAFAIDWPLPVGAMSDRDRSWPLLAPGS
ncbi:MAG TPA: dTDP-4-dehydrorhamnose 3,5-epimerase [Hyphomicrobium sp.]|nr:dTDP-4-dehydrorhamnose 3,5-epimerase [Hyphomicrobium sp.]